MNYNNPHRMSRGSLAIAALAAMALGARVVDDRPNPLNFRAPPISRDPKFDIERLEAAEAKRARKAARKTAQKSP
jgi:hypothetical protein